MDEMRAKALALLTVLDEEQLRLVLAYASTLRDGRDVSRGLEELLEEPA